MPDGTQKSKVIDIRGRLGADAVVEELAGLFREGDHTLRDAGAVLRQGVNAYGKDVVAEALCRRLTGLKPEEDPAFLVWALESIGGKAAITRLRKMVEDERLAGRIRTDAAMVLESLGEEVDLRNLPSPGPQDFQAMLSEIEGQVKQVPEGVRAFMLNELLDQVIGRMGASSRADLVQAIVEALKAQQHPVATDILWAMQEFGPDEEARSCAAQALTEARKQGMEPRPEMVAGTYGGRFARAYVSDMQAVPAQGQMFVAWEQQKDCLIVFSFLIDNVFWGGALKDFFYRSSMTDADFDDMVAHSRRFGIPMVEVDADRARKTVVEALQANVRKVRPVPEALRRYRRLIDRTLFRDAPPLSLPSSEDEARSPLSGAAKRVEELLRDRMPGGGFSPEQVRNARMLWRDFFEACSPSIGKAEVWAASVDYTIGSLDRVEDQTQQAVAARYGVSAGSVSNRSLEIREGFLDVEQGAIAYMTEEAEPEGMENLLDMMFDPEEDEEDLEDLTEEEMLEIDYEEYLEAYEDSRKTVRRLGRTEFARLNEELESLVDLEETAGLTQKQSLRLLEIERLLLLE